MSGGNAGMTVILALPTTCVGFSRADCSVGASVCICATVLACSLVTDAKKCSLGVGVMGGLCCLFLTNWEAWLFVIRFFLVVGGMLRAKVSKVSYTTQKCNLSK